MAAFRLSGAYSVPAALSSAGICPRRFLRRLHSGASSVPAALSSSPVLRPKIVCAAAASASGSVLAAHSLPPALRPRRLLRQLSFGAFLAVSANPLCCCSKLLHLRCIASFRKQRIKITIRLPVAAVSRLYCTSLPASPPVPFRLFCFLCFFRLRSH